MSKLILLSIKPKWVAKILNGEKTIEIRKTVPKCDLPITVYIYCSKGNKNTCLEYADYPDKNKEGMWCITRGYPYANGKVVAKFTVRKVEEIDCIPSYKYDVWVHNTKSLNNLQLMKKSCLNQDELTDYLGEEDGGYAYHIEDLVIFDKPKELSEFYTKTKINELRTPFYPYMGGNRGIKVQDIFMTKPLTKAPQNFCYVESEE